MSINQNKPTISVLILSYNHVDYLEKCIKSVYLNVNQLYDIEIIVLDDGSDDGSVELLKRIKSISPVEFKLILKKHGGVEYIARNFNEMIQLASGDFISFLASDDEYNEQRFIAQLGIMQSNDNCVAVYANGYNIKSGENLGFVHPSYMIEIFNDVSGKTLLRHVMSTVPTLFIQSILVRANFIRVYEAFDPDLIADDWVFNIKLLKKIVDENKYIGYVEDVVFVRNLHATNTSFNYPVHYLRMEQVADRYSENKQTIMMEVVARGLARSIISMDNERFKFYFKKGVKNPLLLIVSVFSIAYSIARNIFR